MTEPSSFCLDLMARAGAESPISELTRSSHHLVAHALPDAKAARRARQIVREVLRDAGVDEWAVGDAELAVGELAANAVSSVGNAALTLPSPVLDTTYWIFAQITTTTITDTNAANDQTEALGTVLVAAV